MRLFLSCLFSLLPTLAIAAQCPNVGLAPKTMIIPTQQYASTEGFSLREDGILLFDYGASYNNLGKWADSYFNSNYANGLYRDWLASNCTDNAIRKKFLHVADWLIEDGEWRGKELVWTYPFYNKYYHLEPGWISGIGQARIAGILLRAEAMTGDKKYRKAADAAMLSYVTPITQGGVLTREGDADWFEEAPDPHGRSYKVLNGHITAMLGILDYARITKADWVMDLYQGGLNAVRRDLEKFDGGFSSLYSLDIPNGRRPIAPLRDYNIHHVSQLLWLFEEHGDPLFLTYASRFMGFEQNNDRYTANHSINAKTNGPERARAFYGSAYWSDGSFPTWIEVAGKRPEWISGLAVDGNGDQGAPSDFHVVTWQDGKWVTQASVKNNEKAWLDVTFPKPVKTQYTRLVIDKPSQDGVVALQAVMLIRTHGPYAPVLLGKDAPAEFPLNQEVDPRMKLRVGNYVILPVHKDLDMLDLVTEQGNGQTLQFAMSDDLKNWKPLTEQPAKPRLRLHFKAPPQQFIRISASGPVDITSLEAIAR